MIVFVSVSVAGVPFAVVSVVEKAAAASSSSRS